MGRGRRLSSGKTRGSKKSSIINPSSAKRRKTAVSTDAGFKTPFISGITGHEYFYNEVDEETHVFIRYNPIKPDVEVPPSVTNFLTNAVKPFAKELHDILISPHCLISIVTLDENEIEKYYQFCRPGKHRIPNTDCFLHASSCDMREVLCEIYGEGYLSNDSDSDIADSFEDLSTDSSSEEYNPIPPWKRGQSPEAQITISEPMSIVSELPKSSPVNVASTSAALADPAALASAVLEEELSRWSTAPQIADQVQNTETEQPAAVTVQPAKPRGKLRFQKIDFSKLEVEVPTPSPMMTIIFRTCNEADSLKKVNSIKLFKELISKGGMPQETRDIRNGGLAVDFLPETPSGPLLQITDLQGISVTASLPMMRSTSAGVIKGVHWELTEDEILTESRTTPDIQITSAQRLARPDQRSWVVKLTFQGLLLPERVFLAGRSHRIHTYLEKPLQCLACARYGHSARVCRSSPRCLTCSQDHDSKTCQNKDAPSCAICKGPHPANSNLCPNRGFQTKVAEVRATTNSTFKAARKAVSAAARTYAAAVKTTLPTPKAPETPAQRPAPAPAFKPNVAQPRPKPPPADANSLATLFQGLVAILTTAIATQDFQGAFSKMAALFLSKAPGADPELFRISP